MSNRYDTLVVLNATDKTPPMAAAGGEVVAWSRGHDLAFAEVLREFVQRIADGEMYLFDDLEGEAEAVIERANQYRDRPEDRP